MPLVVITGIPCSGKTTTGGRLKEFFEKEKGKGVKVISENDLVDEDKAETYHQSKRELVVRGTLKSETLRHLNKDRVLILDGLNYIKGFRYELYCGSKAIKTTQCTVYCDVSPEDAWSWNLERKQGTMYDKETFDVLIKRYEAPISRNSWDSPLFLSLKDLPLNMESVYDALFERKPPPPNQSTQCQPLASTSFLYELDKIVGEIISAVLSCQRQGLAGEGDEIGVPGTKEKVVLHNKVTMAQMTRIKRQFIVYARARGISDVSKLATMFVQYTNSRLSGVDEPDLE